MLKAGFGKAIISPPLGAPLAGFAAREGVCEGVHDELHSRALVLECRERSVALVSVDVLALAADFVNEVKSKIHIQTGIDRDSIAVASTHTHAGPVTVKTFFNPEDTLDQEYMASLADAIVESVAAAWRSRIPSRVGVGSGSVEGIGVNRRTADRKPVDEEIGIIKVEDEKGQLRAVVMNYSCHPTVLGSNNLLATGDFPYFAVDHVEKEIGREGFAMFVNGTQGNISMGHSSELSAIGIITPGRTFEHAEELGKKLGMAVMGAIGEIDTNDTPTIASAVLEVQFPLKSLPDVQSAGTALKVAEEELAAVAGNGQPIESLMSAKSKRLYASITDFYARETSALDGRLPIELQALRIDDSMFLAIPAEVFVEIGLELKRRARSKTYVIGISNGYIGYLPTEAAHAVGGYEVVSSKVAPESEHLLYREAAKLEGMLWQMGVEDPSASISN